MSRDRSKEARPPRKKRNRLQAFFVRGLITVRHPLEAYADLLFAKPQGIKSILVL